MRSRKFNINIALIGHVSVGKTTLLNAILGDKFSEVRKKRTTAGISHFHISPLLKSSQTNSKDTKSTQCPHEDKVTDTIQDDGGDDDHGDGNIKTSNQTLTEISQDNIKLRKLNIIQDKHYHIELHETLFDMRPDTSLTIIDVPGLNEAGTQDMYTSYVEKSWETYSCVIVVMDVSQGVNTEEQVKLLKFVESNVRTKKDIPVIVICNKVDDEADEELMELVNEVQAEVDKVFQTKINRKNALSEILQGPRSKVPHFKFKTSSPAFVHMSAENAFLYRSVSSLSFEDFSTQVDEGHIDRIGKVELGYVKWRKINLEQKYKAIHDLLSDPSEYEERLAMTNYDKLMMVLRYFVGGDDNQKYLIGQQIDVEIDHLSKEGGFAKRLSHTIDSCIMVDKDVNKLIDRFWALFKECKHYYLSLLKDGPKNVQSVHTPMQELIDYYEAMLKKVPMALEEGDLLEVGEHNHVLKEMRDMVNEYINLVISKISDQNDFESLYDPYFKCCGYWINFKNGAVIKDGQYSFSNSSHKLNSPKNNTFSFGSSESGVKHGHPDSDKNVYTFNFGSSESGVKHGHPYPDKYVDCWEWKTDKGIWINKHTKQERGGTHDINPACSFPRGWTTLSKRDCSNILNSMLLMCHNHHFYDYFGNAILDLTWFSNHNRTISWERKCTNCDKVYRKSYFSSHKTCDLFVDNISNKTHFGHLIWLYCRFMESMDIKS